ncbi:MAG: tetratricopeptide repeat protein [Candidatus Marinimicrobia bacterium]|nr:tetratricopeptide repeat protein [Candidatus Neomarinimicrobiota bacterium]
MGYIRSGCRMVGALVTAGMVGFAWLLWGGTPLLAQDQQEEDLYLMDLGIVIEPVDPDASGVRAAQLTNDIRLMVGKGPAGAAYVASTKELRHLLEDLSQKINHLENSLDQDMEAVRLENARLRALIRKIQTQRQTAEGPPPKDGSPPGSSLTVEAARAVPIPDQPSYQHVFKAYRAGRYDQVLALCRQVDRAASTPDEGVQLGYWCADAYYRTGQFDEALASLDKTAATDHELQDDAIILRGLILMKQGRTQAARAQFETIIQQYPTSEYHRLAELTAKELNN